MEPKIIEYILIGYAPNSSAYLLNMLIDDTV